MPEVVIEYLPYRVREDQLSLLFFGMQKLVATAVNRFDPESVPENWVEVEFRQIKGQHSGKSDLKIRVRMSTSPARLANKQKIANLLARAVAQLIPRTWEVYPVVDIDWTEAAYARRRGVARGAHISNEGMRRALEVLNG